MMLSQSSKEIEKAYQIAKAAHKGQVDKGGHDYINHPLTVAESVNSEAEKIVALLHDVVEDTPITLQNLYEQGFPYYIVKAIDCITKRDNESLEAYLERVKSDSLATTVKIADLTHNSDISRIPKPTKKDYDRIKRYKKEIDFLLN